MPLLACKLNMNLYRVAWRSKSWRIVSLKSGKAQLFSLKENVKIILTKWNFNFSLFSLYRFFLLHCISILILHFPLISCMFIYVGFVFSLVMFRNGGRPLGDDLYCHVCFLLFHVFILLLLFSYTSLSEYVFIPSHIFLSIIFLFFYFCFYFYIFN